MCRLKEEELYKIIKGGETLTVEFKTAPPRPVEVAERLCGMANAQGGILIIGVEDKNFTIVGISDLRQAKDVILRATRIIQPVLLLDPPEPEVYILDDKQLVIATVPPNRGSLYQSSGVCWIRRSTHTLPLTVPEIAEFANNSAMVRWELQPACRATLKDIDWERVKLYLNHRSIHSRLSHRFYELESVLIGMGGAVVTESGEVQPTNAGILFFGFDPQLYVPQSEIVCVLFDKELGSRGYTDREVITGTLTELIDGVNMFLRKHMLVGIKKDGLKPSNEGNYPFEVLLEATVNAVVHRDYTRTGERIRIFCYTDRIEIHSPGVLLPGITTTQMEQGKIISKLRNPLLGVMLRDTPGYMEGIGSGIRLMFYHTKRARLPAPQFQITDEFVISFYNTSSGLINKGSEKQKQNYRVVTHSLFELSEDAALTQVVRVFPESAGIPSQKDRLVMAMRYVHEHESITNREHRKLTNVAINTALNDLELLVSQGALKALGKTRGRQYKLP